MGYHALFQGIFPTQGPNSCPLCLLHLASEFFITSATWEALLLYKLYTIASLWGWGGDFLFSWSRLFPPTDNMCRNSLDPILFHLYLWQLFYVCSEPGVQTGVTKRALNIRGLGQIMGRHQLYWGRGPGPPAATLVSLWISCVETTFLCWASITWLWLPLQPKHCYQMSRDHVIYLRERELPEGRSYALQHRHPGAGLGECSDSDISY